MDAVVRHWLALLLLVAVAAVNTYFISSSSPKVYTSTVLLLPAPTPPALGQTGSVTNSGDQTRTIATEALQFTSRAVLARAGDIVSPRLSEGRVAAHVTTSTSDTSNSVTIAVTGSTAKAAADLANAVTSAYLDTRREQANKSVSAATKGLAVQRKLLEQQLRDLNARPSTDPTTRSVDEVQRTAILQQLQSLIAQQSNLAISDSLYSPLLQVSRSAGLASLPSSPVPKRDTLLAILIAGVAGTALAWGYDLHRARRRSLTPEARPSIGDRASRTDRTTMAPPSDQP